MPYISALTDRGILTLPAGMTVIRLLPPLVITQEQVDRVCHGVSRSTCGAIDAAGMSLRMPQEKSACGMPQEKSV